jgi:hypothetical protein
LIRRVFARRTSLEQHFARLRLADLFLDTLPCNALDIPAAHGQAPVNVAGAP